MNFNDAITYAKDNSVPEDVENSCNKNRYGDYVYPKMKVTLKPDSDI